MANIKKVAERAGVSTSTVSRALSGKIFVKEETREKILAAVAELNYRPNLMARGLKEGRSTFIALVLPNITNPTFAKLVKCIEKYAADQGYSIILFDSDEDPVREAAYVESMGAHFVDGVLLISASDDIAHAAILKTLGIPLVVVNREFPSGPACVANDNYAGAKAVVAHLIEQGHERIACLIVDTAHQRFRQRRDGCLDAFREKGIVVPEKFMLDKMTSIEAAYAATAGLLSGGDRPTAIFSSIDLLTFGVYSAANDLGLKIPDDVSVAGFDNMEISRHMTPPLTTYELPADGVAATAVKTLVEAMENPGAAAGGTIVVGGQLVVRASVKRL